MILKRLMAITIAISLVNYGAPLAYAEPYNPVPIPPDPNLAAEACIECTTPKIPLQPGLEETIRSVQDATSAVPVEDVCAKKGYFFDPKNKSILQEYGINYKPKEADVGEIIARSAMTCLYGAIRGGYLSLKDLIMAIPSIMGMTYRGMKSAGAAIRDFDYKGTGQAILDADYRGWLATLSPYNIYDKATGAYRVTRDAVAKTYSRATESLYDSYQTGGVTGAMAAVAQAAYATSPHAVIGKLLKDVGLKVWGAIKSEWDAFICQDWEVISQLVCTAVGYVVTDILLLKGAFSAISKLPKFAELMQATKAKMERAPIVGGVITRDFKAAETSVCQGISNWMVDSRMKLQNQDIDVAAVGGKIFARGISPTTRQMGCFEVTGSTAAGIASRIQSTLQRVHHVDDAVKPAGVAPAAAAAPAPGAVAPGAAAPGAVAPGAVAPGAVAPGTAPVVAPQTAAITAADLDIYSSRAAGFARSPADFVSSVNRKAGVSLSGRDSSRIASALGSNAAEMDKYGALLRSVDQLREAAKTAVRGTPEGDAVFRALSHAEDGIRTLNSALAKSGTSRNVNLELLGKAFTDAALTRDPTTLSVMNRALYEFNKTASRNGAKFDDSVKAWENAIKRDRPHLTADEIAKARQCLFPMGAK